MCHRFTWRLFERAKASFFFSARELCQAAKLEMKRRRLGQKLLARRGGGGDGRWPDVGLEAPETRDVV